MSTKTISQKTTQKNKNSGGFSYVEVLVAMAILTIIMLPILPALTQAQANHTAAINRRIAQGHAVTLATNIQANPAAPIMGIINEIAAINDEEFIYRVTLLNLSGNGNPPQYFSPNTASLEVDLPAAVLNFGSADADLFTGTFVLAEVFGVNGELLGMSVGKRGN
ncbi:MAG: prepilin-type N-terminal cleavage/methylation domain-containing protein [Defluviitaleaceae bacterium]|nr:prepilin-type N-terminal cleavage/methylation domain-containing protein [Defluviitaleaceae bacterium]